MAMYIMVKEEWRPENWEKIRARLANESIIWSPSGPNLNPTEQIVEATASKILEELGKVGWKEVMLTEKDKDEVKEVEDAKSV